MPLATASQEEDPFDLVSAAPDFDSQEWATPLLPPEPPSGPAKAKPQQKRKKRPRSPHIDTVPEAANGTSLHLDDMDSPRPPAKSTSIPSRQVTTGFAKLGIEPLQSLVVQTIPDMVLSDDAVDAIAALLRNPRPLCACEECVARFKRVIGQVRQLFCHLADHEADRT